MKYGLVVFACTDNLGDDIQSYAAKKFLPQIDYFIEREELDSFIPHQAEPVATIMNGWFLHSRFNWPPSPYLYPFLTSMHFNQIRCFPQDITNEYLSGVGAEYLRHFSPVGCRDHQTQKILKARNIKTYLSYCLTLTLDPLPNLKSADYILLVDVAPKITAKVCSHTRKQVKFFSCQLERNNTLSNPFGPTKRSLWTWKKREKQVCSYLKLIQQASLVITSRLHCALPALALDTKVLLIDYDANINRTQSFWPFLTHLSESDFLSPKCDYNLDNPPPNNNKHLPIRKKIASSCHEFIKKTRSLPAISDLPSVQDYQQFLARSQFQKHLLLSVQTKLQKTLS
jgi:hypothetical protein